MNNEKKYLFFLGIISIVSFFSNIWVRPVGLMEARNFITAREMVQNKNFLIPTLNGALRFEKPPLPTWLTAFVMKITNNFTDEWILRIPVVIVGILTVFFIYFLVKSLTKNNFLSFLAGFVASSNFMIIKMANENSWDFYTYAFALGMLTFLVRGLENGKLKEFFLSGILASASIMSKGPVGIYGLVIPFLIAHIFVYGLEKYIKNSKKIIFLILIGFLFSAIWPYLVVNNYGEIFWSILKKEEGTWMNSHKKSFFYYMDYFVYMGVWIFFTICTYLRKWNDSISENEKYSRMLFYWGLLVFIAISIIKMKKKRYGIPLFMVSTLSVADLCYYFCNSSLEKLKKYEKLLIYIQGFFLGITSIGVIGLFVWSYFKGQMSLVFMVFLSMTYILFLISLTKKINQKEKAFPKFIVFSSGLLFIWINITTNWIFSKNIVDKKIELKQCKDMREFHNNPPKEDIYSINFGIEDVWRMGKTIKQFEKNQILPKKMVFFSDLPEGLEKEYKILKKEKYKNEVNEVVDIYFLEKRDD